MKMDTFGACKVKTDEEFALWYENRNRKMMLLPVLGLAAFVFGILNETFGWADNSHMSSVVSGIGGALIACGLVLTLRWKRIKKNAKLLHKMRLQYTDERNAELGRRALAASAYITIFACFAAMLVVGWFSDVAFWCFYGMIFFVVFVYLGCWFYYNKKM